MAKSFSFLNSTHATLFSVCRFLNTLSILWSHKNPVFAAVIEWLCLLLYFLNGRVDGKCFSPFLFGLFSYELLLCHAYIVVVVSGRVPVRIVPARSLAPHVYVVFQEV